MTGHVILPYEIYIFIFDNAWASSVDVVVECKVGMLVIAVSILGQVKKFLVENLSLKC